MSAPTALYRRYRPDSFADVIGQDHVTVPLMAALEKDRVNHAYLFSGPRGCGKTTSARILARCLNCAQGPTAHPCGVCDSCVELARGGSGSLDVIEIDAASHGGVDDARDLRERATFAPIRDRYKIFIIDEAHMVTSAGFNALLKIVEEPPEHIKFIFATTEPDKVIGTIRSRTHHYPFRLVPPEPLMKYLGQLCEIEKVAVAPGVLSLVIRAGGGSVRDSLSVLDQLMAGAGPDGLNYELAVDLLGYTHSSLLDDVVEALAAGDSATVFRAVDRVIQTGHDPRRFVEDLLERFRDLIIVAAMPENAHAILRGTPDELIARMQTQAAQLGPAELSRAADVTNAAFNEMTGATSPRLHLELLGARLLLPGADSTARGMGARLDQMERRLNYGGTTVGGVPAVSDGIATAESTPSASAINSDSHARGAALPASGDGLAAVRAQLAKAKSNPNGREAGNSVSDAPLPEGDSWGIPMQEHRSASIVQPSITQNRTPAAPATSSATAPTSPNPATDQRASSDQKQPPRSTSSQKNPSWDDLPTPNSSADFAPQAPDAPSTAQSTKDSTAQSTVQGTVQAPNQANDQTPPQGPVKVQSGEVPVQPSAGSSPALGTKRDATANFAQRAEASSEIDMIRRAWPEILTKLSNIRKASWVMVNQNVVPRAFDGQILRVALPTTALIQTFQNSGHADNLRQAIHQTLGINCQLDPITGDAPAQGTSAEPNPKELTESPTNPQKPVDTVAAALVTPALGNHDSTPKQTVPAPATSSGPTSWEEPLHEEPNWEDPPHWDDSAPDQHSPQSLDPSVQSDSTEHVDSTVQSDSTDSSETAKVTEPIEPAEVTEPTVSAPEPYRPKVSPISAWTTGWDTPTHAAVLPPPLSTSPTPPPSTLKRSEMLAAMAAKTNDHAPEQDSKSEQVSPHGNDLAAGQAGADSDPADRQEWSSALSSASRNEVKDSGWGAPSSAPDWATSDPEPVAPGSTASLASSEQAAVETQAGSAPVEKLSMYQRLSNSPEAKASRAKTPTRAAKTPHVEDVPSPDDVTIEESGKAGQAAVERILGGQLIEERPFGPR